MVTFKFTHLKNSVNSALSDAGTQEYLTKWAMKGNLRVQHYCFNEPFQVYQKEDLVNSFFQDPVVINTLEIEPSIVLGKPCSRVEWCQVPCTVTSMNFFDNVLDPENKVIFDNQNKALKTCEYSEIDGFTVADNLRKMLLEEESELHAIVNTSEREQFLFRLFKSLCLGGLWCQYEDYLQPYLEVTKALYKSLLSAEKDECSGQVVIRSIVFDIAIYDEVDEPILPKNPRENNNFLYLIVDPVDRTATLLVHQVGRLIL